MKKKLMLLSCLFVLNNSVFASDKSKLQGQNAPAIVAKICESAAPSLTDQDGNKTKAPEPACQYPERDEVATVFYLTTRAVHFDYGTLFQRDSTGRLQTRFALNMPSIEGFEERICTDAEEIAKYGPHKFYIQKDSDTSASTKERSN